MILLKRRPIFLFKALIVVVPLIWLVTSVIFVFVDQQRTTSIDDDRNWFGRIYDLIVMRSKYSYSGIIEGAGEMGKPLVLPSDLPDEVQKKIELGWKRNQYNEFVSDLISVHRSLPEVRHRGCLNETYSEDLPKTSIIICFYNEAWSVLLRGIHSILDRSPAHLIQEIILVDDFSNMAHLGSKLDKYVKSLEKVHIVRTQKREGLARARNLGVSVAKGPVLTFLDSNCECTEGWLKPLLQRIHDNRMAVVSPVIDYIDSDTFAYPTSYERVFVGGFFWDLEFFSFASAERDKTQTHHWSSIKTPAIEGPAFAIDKNFLEQLGNFDDGFEILGGENLEISFKTWMCGGELEIIPCSHVGHVVRLNTMLANSDWPAEINVKRNYVRIAEVWLDDYKWCYYLEIMEGWEDFGDVESRREIRRKLNCKSFDWYLKNIYPERAIPSEKPLAFGEIRNLGAGGDTCLAGSEFDDQSKKPFGPYPCSDDYKHWKLTDTGEIKRDEDCMDYTSTGSIILYPCKKVKGNQEWIYDLEMHSIRNPESGKCLALSEDKKQLLMEDCTGKDLQRWKFGYSTVSKATNNTDVTP